MADIETPDPPEIVEETAPPVEPPEKPEAPEPEETPPAAAQTIPLSELKAERAKRQKVEREWEQYRAQSEARFADLVGRFAPQPAEPAKTDEKPPAFETDPAAYLRWQAEQHDRELRAVKGDVEAYKAQEQERTRHQQAMTQLTSAAAAAEAEFMAEAPDYHDALAHLRREVTADIQAESPWLTPQQVVAELNRRELHIAASSLQAGRSPAEVAYGLAKRRGYAKVAQPGNTAVLEAKRAGTARSLSSAPGAPSGKPRWDDIVKMDQTKYLQTVRSKEDFRRLHGVE